MPANSLHARPAVRAGKLYLTLASSSSSGYLEIVTINRPEPQTRIEGWVFVGAGLANQRHTGARHQHIQQAHADLVTQFTVCFDTDADVGLNRARQNPAQ